MKSARLVPLLLGVLTLGASGAAMAGGLNVGVNIGIPAPVYVAPAPVYAPPPDRGPITVVVVTAAGLAVTLGLGAMARRALRRR